MIIKLFTKFFNMCAILWFSSVLLFNQKSVCRHNLCRDVVYWMCKSCYWSVVADLEPQITLWGNMN